jgi:hypothetical protein
MITAIAPSIHALRAEAPAPAPPPAPAPAPLPPEPADSVNFDTIDTPVKAALLPVLDPGVLSAIVIGAVIGGGSAAGVLVTADILTGTDAVRPDGATIANGVRSSFQINTKDTATPITEGGLLGDRFDAGSLTVDQATKTATWRQAGDIELVFTPDAAANGKVKVDGHLGTVEAHLAIAQIEESLPGNSLGIRAEGTLGGEAYNVDTTLTIASMGRNGEGASASASMSARGKLGSDDIAKDYTLSAEQNGQGASMTVHGTGKVGAVPIQIDVEAHIAH